jgi:hypothetical protein
MSSIFRSIFIPVCLVWIVSLAIPWHEAWPQSFWATVLRITGISATPSQLKGPGDEVQDGDVWVADLAHRTRLRVTRDGGYRSPVFSSADENILALKGNTVVQLPLSDGEPKKLYSIKGVTKIVGLDREDADKVLILLQDVEGRDAAGLLSLKSGQVTPLTYDRKSQDHRRMISHMKEWERVYGDAKVYVRSESKRVLSGTIGWTDVYLKKEDSSPLNVSRCDGVNCGQPSLSYNGRQVVFVKAAE